MSVVVLNKRTAPVLLTPGTVFGRLTATSEYEMRQRPDGRNRAYQKFDCSCGNSVLLVAYSVKQGNTSSCGCLHSEKISAAMKTHGLSKTSAYRVALNKARRSQKRAALYTDNVEKVSAAVFTEILAEYGNLCWICESTLEVVQWDHVHPLSKGGSHTRSNLRPSCQPCNGRKGAIHPFTDAMKDKVATAVRASRMAQALPVTDGKEVIA